MSYLEQLNENQRTAVLCTDGPMLVIAGAGSGKTRVLTYKIAHLLQQGIPAYNILALTFTNKAAREMKSRIAQLVGEDTARYLWMGTFHSIFARILRQEADKLGYTRDYSIYDTTDSQNMIKSIVKDFGLSIKDYKPKELQQCISRMKNEMRGPEDTQSGDFPYTIIDRGRQIYREYNKRLHQANAMDFDDLLLKMNVLLTQYPDIRSKYQELFRYILVDEYQDTNFTQYKIVNTLALPHNNLCVVGDDAQSIYSFRGATIENILSFQKQYPTAKVIKLEENYRSTQTIVNAANSVIANNNNRLDKEIFSNKEVGNKLRFSSFRDEETEAEYVIQTIQQKVKREYRSYADFTILYRTNSQSQAIENICLRKAIPYRIYGGLGFYQRKDIKDTLAYFRLVANLRDEESLKRVIEQVQGIGNTTLIKIIDAAHQLGCSVFEIIQNPQEYNIDFSASTKNKLHSFAEVILDLKAKSSRLEIADFAHYLYDKVGILARHDNDEDEEESRDRKEKLLDKIEQFQEDQHNDGETFVLLNDFLARVALLTDQDEQSKNEGPHISMMTVHNAKGLEFPIVFIVGLDEGTFPSSHSQTMLEKEEERRLFYVAITRAEEECYLSHVETRWQYGEKGQRYYYTPAVSSFIQDIGTEFLNHDNELKHTWHTYNQHSIWGKQQFVSEQNYPFQNTTSYREYNPEPVCKVTTPLPSTIDTTKLTKTTGRQPKGDKTEIATVFPIGSRVQHGTFGKGTVVRAYLENGNEKIEIRFDAFSAPKTLLLKFAKLILL